MKYYLKKLAVLFVTLFMVSLITFGVFQILPGDPVLVMLGVDADPAQADILREKLGLTAPLPVRYLQWVTGLLHGDMGTSYKYSRPVSMVLAQRIQPTVILALLTITITVVVGIPLGIRLARDASRWYSGFLSGLTQLGLAIPAFWFGILLILIFAVHLNLIPAGGYVRWEKSPAQCIESLILPAVALSFGTTATVVRYLRNTLLDQMSKDYVRTARSKGLKERTVIYRHVLRNALIPVLTIMAMLVTDILAGSIIIETVFSIPGLGSIITASITSRDFPLLQSTVMYIAALVVIINTAVDILYSVIDPRIRVK